MLLESHNSDLPVSCNPSPLPNHDLSSCGDHSLFFSLSRPHSGRPYLNLTMTHALVLFMDMPNLTFTMVIQGDTLRWLRFRWKPVFVAVEKSRSHRFHGQPFSI